MTPRGDKVVMRWFVGIVGLVLVLVAAAPAAAMTFRAGETSSGLRVVVASGEIVRGDARRLARALEKAGTDRHGTKLLYLDSPGGLVAEAMKMAALIEETGVTIIVRKDALCASACASILFVSAKYRTVESGGKLAIHGCYNTFTGRGETECNALISAYADSVGVNGTAMMALQEAAGSESAIVFDREDAACFGLTRKPGTTPSKRVPPCVADMLKALGR